MKTLKINFILFCLLITGISSNIRAQELENSPIRFVYLPSEFDSFLLDNFVRPEKALLHGINSEFTISFEIDSTGLMRNIDILNFDTHSYITSNNTSGPNLDSIAYNYKSEAMRVIKFSEGLWYPAKVNGNYYNDTIVIHFLISTPNYKDKSRDINSANGLEEMVSRINQNPHYAELDVPYTSADKYYNLGIKKLQQNFPIIAIKYFNYALSIKNDDINTWYNLGIAYFQNKNKTKACQCWIQAMRLGDKDAASLLNEKCK